MADSSIWDESDVELTEDSLFGELLKRIASSDEADTAAIATRFEGHPRFQLREPLGRGGFGAVYRAYDRHLDVEIALKVLHRGSPSALYRFKQEFRRVQGLVHPCLVRLHELHAEELGWFLTMDLIPGMDWGDWLSPGRLPEEGERVTQLTRLLPQLLDGISALHGALLLHRDLKPGNVRITPDGQVVILDFGLAVSQSLQDEADVSGTPAYMAPELQRGVGPSPVSDLFALGVMIYEAVMGSREGVEAFAQSPRVSLGETPHSRLLFIAQSLLAPEPEGRMSLPEILANLGWMREGEPRDVSRGILLQGSIEPPPAAVQDAVARRWGRAQRGRPQLLVLEGVGHRRARGLLGGVAQHIVEGAPGTQWLSGVCRLQESLPYRAFDGVLDQLAQVLLAMDPAHRRALLPLDMKALAHVFPSFQVFSGASLTPRGSGESLRLRAVAALRSLLVRLGQECPILMTIEDLHWSDGDSALPLIAILSSPSPLPLLVVSTSRFGLGEIEERIDGTQFWGASDGAVQRLVLAPQGKERTEAEESSAPLSSASLSLRGRTPEDVDLLIALGLVPAPLEQPLAARIAGFDDADGSIQGLIDGGFIAHAGGHRLRLEPGVLSLLEAEVSRERRVEIAHHLVGLIEKAGVPNPRRLSHIWGAVGEVERGVELLREGAQRARSRGALEEAASLFALVGELRGWALEDVKARAECLGAAGRSREAARLYLEISEACEPQVRASHLGHAAEQFIVSGQLRQGLKAVEAALRAGGLPSLQHGLLGGLRLVLTQLGLGRRINAFRAREAQSFSRDELAFLDVSWSLGIALSQVDLVIGYQVLSVSLLRSLQVGEPTRVARALHFRAFLMELSGAPKEKVDVVKAQAKGLDTQLDGVPGREAPWLFQAIVLSVEGQFEDALLAIDEASRVLEASPAKATHALVAVQGMRQNSLYWLGRFGDLRDHYNGAADIHRLRGSFYGLSHLTAIFGWLEPLMLDRPQEAMLRIEEGEAGWGEDGINMQTLTLLFARCHTYLYQGEYEQAVALLESKQRLIKGSGLLRIKMNRWRLRLIHARVLLSLLEASEGGSPRERKHRVAQIKRLLKGVKKNTPDWVTGIVFASEARLSWCLGEEALAIERLGKARERIREVSAMGIYHAYGEILGGWLGGGAGQALRKESLDFFAHQGVQVPYKLARMLA